MSWWYILLLFITVLVTHFFSRCESKTFNVPPNRLDELGRGTWTYLNLSIVKYPISPTLAQQEEMHRLITTILEFYPCDVCRVHAQTYLLHHPLNESLIAQEALKEWMIAFHNNVNQRCSKDKVYTKDDFDREWKICIHCT